MRICDLLDRAADLYGPCTAVSIVGGSSYTYSELRDRVCRLAGGLAKRGVSREDRVAVVADNGITFFDTYLAVSYLGASAVPVNTRLAPREAAFILGHAKPSVVIVDGPHEKLISSAPITVPVLETDSTEFRQLLDGSHLDGSHNRTREEDIALIIYTSGTTGRPKGVCLSQRALTFNALTLAVSQQLRHEDVFLSTTPLYHAATASRVMTMLIDGQSHVVLPEFNVETCLEVISAYGVTTTVLVTTQLRRVLASPSLSAISTGSLRLLVYGGSPTPVPLIRGALEVMDCGLYQGYGLTEAVTNLTALTPDDHLRGDENLLRSCGKPVPGVQIQVRDEGGRAVPTGEVGEIFVKSDKTMVGYWRNPDATSDALPGDWLRTGDLGRKDTAGYLYIVGRAKDMLISGGVNIYPIEVEDVLHAHEAVSEAAVIGVPDDEWGEIPVAFVVPKRGNSLDIAQLDAWCRAHLSHIKAPRQFEVVDALPKTASGKVRKVDLREKRVPPMIDDTH